MSKTKNENIVNEEEIQKTILDTLDEKTAVSGEPDSETAGGLVISANGLKSAGGDRLAETNMIQKHLDNFLAKIAGETPVDDQPRNSTEYWLNKIAESGGGGGVDMYMHDVTISAPSGNRCYIRVISLNNTKMTYNDIVEYVGTKTISATGYAVISNTRNPIFSLLINDGNMTGLGIYIGDSSLINSYFPSNSTITDIVTKIV